VRLDRAAKLTPSNSSVSIAIRWSRRPAPRWAIARSTTLDVETFRGNGRTCRTCHSKKNGTFSPEDARERLAEDPTDSLFVHDGLDGGLEGTFPSLGFANLLKIPTLWSVARTGRIATTILRRHWRMSRSITPYFRFGTLGFDFTGQDQADMVAFLKLLR
jgi:hypothetical protein